MEWERTHQSKAMFVEQSPPSGPVGAVFTLLLGSGQQMTDMQWANSMGMCLSYLPWRFLPPLCWAAAQGVPL